MMPLARPASCFKTVRRLMCLSLAGNSGSLEKSGVNFSQQSIVASLDELSSPAHTYRSVEVLYSEEVIKIQQEVKREINL
jgi:hypothetical protein